MTLKLLVVLCCLIAAVLASDKYTDKYDNINIKEILETKRLLIAYLNCIMDRGKCTPDGKELKDHIEDALQNGCEKCTDHQKDSTTIVLHHLIEHELDMWKELCGKYDPDGVWRKKYEQTAREKGIIIPQD